MKIGVKMKKDNINIKNMTDEDLSKKLGRYQVMESIGILLGVLLVVAGCITAFVLHNPVVLSVLVFGGVALILLLALPAQKKKKALLNQQLGGFFKEELEKMFGEEPKTPELPIDVAYLKSAELTAVPWKECSISDFHEGKHNGLRFSAANVELSRTVEERSGPNNDNWMTRSETLFHGIVLRCSDICDGNRDIKLIDQYQKRTDKDISKPDVFKKYFVAVTADKGTANELITPQLCELVQKLETFANNGKVCALSIASGSLTLALNTRYVFANLPDEIDLRDIDGVRKFYILSLISMGNLIDIIRESPALTQ